MGSYLIYYLAKIPFRDCTNAFKMFSANLKNKIRFDSTAGFTFALELVAKSYFLKLKVVEIPSTWMKLKTEKVISRCYNGCPTIFTGFYIQ